MGSNTTCESSSIKMIILMPVEGSMYDVLTLEQRLVLKHIQVFLEMKTHLSHQIYFSLMSQNYNPSTSPERILRNEFKKRI